MPIPKSWERVGVSRARPNVDPVRAEGPGGAAATGSGDASWRRRLAPHHREIVRRYFGGERTGTSGSAANGGSVDTADKADNADNAEDGR